MVSGLSQGDAIDAGQRADQYFMGSLCLGLDSPTRVPGQSEYVVTASRSTATTVLGILNLLILGEYVALENLTGGNRLSAEELKRAVETYGRRLTWPPNRDIPPDLDIVPDTNNSSRQHLFMSLWTEEEGRSDLSLIVTLTEISSDIFDVEIDDIRVL
jgi:hypothetical protein